MKLSDGDGTGEGNIEGDGFTDEGGDVVGVALSAVEGIAVGCW